MSAYKGLIEFAIVWAKIASELLEDNPWPDWCKAPSGAHGAIDDLEIGALFAEAARRATDNGGSISLEELLRAWVKGTLKVHGKPEETKTPKVDVKDAVPNHVDEEAGRLTRDEKDLLIRRIRIRIQRDMAHLAEFGLIQDDRNVYSLTEKGQTAYKRLVA